MQKNSQYSNTPEMMGTEHELSVVFTPRKSMHEDLDENYGSLVSTENLETFNTEQLYNVPNQLNQVAWENTTNTTKIINNGSFFMEFTERPLELATPECSTPKQLLTYSLASRLLVTEWAKSLLETESKGLRSIAIHERVIDSIGNTWGEHDNFSRNSHQDKWGYNPNETPSVVWLHALTRGCVSGAGHVNGKSRQWSLSQKMPSVSEISNKKWGSTGFFNDDNRIEIRCSDKNISQWSHIVRLGSMAMVLALAHTGYDTNDLGLDTDRVYDDRYIGAFDQLRTNTDGQITFTHVAKIAVSIQKSLSEACINAVDRGDIPESYRAIALTWNNHCEQLDKEVHKNAPVDLSKFMYTDWASKFYYIQQRLNLDKQNILERTPYDYSAMAQDLYYDRILLDAPEPHSKVYIVEGLGYKLNKRIANRNIIGESAIRLAMQVPPESTRAIDRMKMISDLNSKNCYIDYVDWDLIEWLDQSHDSYKHYF